MDAHATTQKSHCKHQAAGALEFADGCWKCRDCGRPLQVLETARGWQVFAQISRCAAYCAVLAACIPVGLSLVPGAGPMTTANATANFAAPRHAPATNAPADIRGEALLVASH